MKSSLQLVLLISFSILSSLGYSGEVESLKIPLGINQEAAFDGYQKYLAEKDNKAFAVADNNSTGWSVGMDTIEQAKGAALSNCEKYSADSPCALVDINGKPIVDMQKTEGFRQEFPSVDGREYPARIVLLDDMTFYLNEYRTVKGNKAFAYASPGIWGWAGGRVSPNAAKRDALKSCRKFNKREATHSCKVVDVNNRIVIDARKSAKIAKAVLEVAPSLPQKWKRNIDQVSFNKYIALNGFKALAITKGANNTWGYSFGYIDQKNAVKEALKICESYNNTQTPCVLVALNNKVVNPKPLPEISKGQPWYGHYKVDLSGDPSLKMMSEMLPSFILSKDKLYVLVSGEVVEEGAYEIDQKTVVIEFLGKKGTAIFDDQYGSFNFVDGDGSRYIK